MAIPDGYRLLTSSDVGKTFGVDLEKIVYFDNSVTPILFNTSYGYPVIRFDSYVGVSGGGDAIAISPTFIATLELGDYSRHDEFYNSNGWVLTQFDIFYSPTITSFATDLEWNNWLYVKDIPTPKEEFISSMNSLGKSITDKAGASGKKSITELKDLVDNLKTTFTGQEKTVTPSKTSQVITPDSGYDGLSKVTVNVIPSSYIIPSGTLAISENGTKDVTQYASVNVNIQPTYWDGTYEESDE